MIKRPHANGGDKGPQGIGASLRRKEDERFMHGRGEYVPNIRMVGMLDVAFVRSPIAHGHIVGIEKPEPFAHAVYTLTDLEGVKPIVANSGLPGFKRSEQPVLASGKVRQVGEPVAMCVAATRAQAEDIAAQVFVDFEELPAVVDMLDARREDSALVHEHWGDNVFLETFVDANPDVDLDAIRRDAPIRVHRKLRTARQSMAPMEGRGVVAHWDRRLSQLIVHTSAQMPHITRTGLAECLGLDEGQVRVIAPDVGGGFGYKGILLPEEVCCGWLAMHLEKPVRWIEDRREQLTANANCREHDYDITGYADRDGRLLAVECEAHVDSGAYSSYPFSACLEAAQVGSILPGPYKMDRFRCRTWSVATNKPPILPYRGVARTGVCYAIETVMDAIALEAGIEPYEVRLRNLVQPHEMPYDNITKKHFDSGDYPEAVRRAMAAIDLPAVRARQERGEPDGRRIGFGMSVFCEQGAHGTSVYHGWGIPMVPGYEPAVIRLTPDGVLEVRAGVHSHGQSMETTLAQIAHEVLGIDTDRVRVVLGDTGVTPYSTGTWGSRSIVMAGGAVGRASKELKERLLKIGAHLLQEPLDDVRWESGAVVGKQDSRTLAQIARTWYLAPQLLPPDVDPRGLEVSTSYQAKRDSGTFSYACHAVIVAVDPVLGQTEILDYAIVEDGGVLINPMVVDGQVYGGAAQGIGTALYEAMPYSEDGQPLASTLADYLLPGATEVPSIRIEHMETPAPYTEFGQKGIGESGAIGPPAALANAVNDALRGLGVRIDQLPVTPRLIVEALARRREQQANSLKELPA
ncbi:xanthine dehydrogenase family protein molybdopterin-binding subunit [Paraburkholderia silvatlantica]|uniref:Carbon-monoxide dehydrogenase large subunit n=1 Tax=Paraburkholderia silvatlantica TaxID=321895 RepID=A0A2U1A7W6_9BURK|nr:xanthine dehydrogenase family protein molybdopterin-binding subunit [Paraburkholderia silvatlantica]MBB2931173.1 carbon-monoxide dehydrogenase large subunit [Paraburkholderia silvatlantica]PVY28667.1 xanthine dehydrogenase molybdenum binding subunit apoprotein [Paraburkholderia silvatlantica]PXW36304.1 xanthine dehydrogenase molybdenum binding subunit apoprotein [Paraburkholderia silvatlantica]PYE21627.1 xanthine dehydrogenase molybdenum binding subunit apoprotein [Paraburkholderia silvatlan